MDSTESAFFVQLLGGGGAAGAIVYLLFKRIIPNLVSAKLEQDESERRREQQREDRLFGMLDANLKRQEERDKTIQLQLKNIDLSLQMVLQVTKAQNELMSYFVNGNKDK